MTERRQVHLAAHFPGVNNHTVWSDPRSGDQVAFASFEHMARTAERGKFDFFFLAEGLRLREQHGRIHDLDVVGRPDAVTVLAGLAAVTERIGLGATVSATWNEPYELARRLATLDHLSGGRAGWNVVTSSGAFFGENFRRGAFLPHEQRYTRAAEFVEVAGELWGSWRPDAVAADQASGAFVRPGGVRRVAHDGPQFTIEGTFTLPPSPQGRPVVIQAGDSDDGRAFGAATADAIFSRHAGFEAGRAFFADMKARAVAAGRRPDDLKILPGVTFALGDTEDEARENARHIRRQQVSPQTAIATLEQVWGRDLSAYDPDGPLPDVEPLVDAEVVQGRANVARDPRETAARWRAIAAERRLSIRELVVEVGGRFTFVGTPASVAEQMDRHVQEGAADGFILVPHLTPGGLDEFVDTVVPELQGRGVFRTEYDGPTLRHHLGLAPGGAAAAA